MSTPNEPKSAGGSKNQPEPAAKTASDPAPESTPEFTQLESQATNVEAPEVKVQREKEDERRRERSFTIRMASITAASALVGALVGGFFTFGAARLQSEADADTEQIAMKKEAFSTFLTDANELTSEEGLMGIALDLYSSTKDRAAVNLKTGSYFDAQQQYANSSNVVSLVGSDQVESARIALAHNTNAVKNDIGSVLSDVGANRPLDPERMKAIRENLSQRQELFTDFAVAAHRDLAPQQHGLLDIFW